jgi:FAD/FMN-containing dehydrogenase
MFASLITAAGFRGILRDDDAARAVYSEAAGVARILPRAVAVPADAEDVATLVRWAAEHRVPSCRAGRGARWPTARWATG